MDGVSGVAGCVVLPLSRLSFPRLRGLDALGRCGRMAWKVPTIESLRLVEEKAGRIRRSMSLIGDRDLFLLDVPTEEVV